MNPSQIAAPTPAPIHDITDPVWFFPYSYWIIVAAAVGFLLLVGLLVWFTRRQRKSRALSAKEKAILSLADLRHQGAESDPYGFGVKVSDALRTYIRDQYGLDAVTRTSIEFLDVLQHNAVFNENEKAAVAEFLESVDLLKYARQDAGKEEINALLEIAERIVRGDHTLPVASEK